MNKYFSILICLVSFQLYTPLYCQQWNEVNPELGAVVDIFELGGTLYTVSNLGLVGSSKDNGITWQTNDIYDVVTLPNGITTCISFFDPGNGLIGVRDVVFGNQLLKSNSSELGWEVSSPEYDQNCSSAFIPINLFRVNDSTMILDGLQSPNYRVTYDKGVTWQCVDNFSGLTGIQVLTVRSDSEWLFNDGEGLHKTTDGGQTWSRISDKNFTHYQELNAQTIIGLTLYIDEPNGIPVIYTTTDDFETVDQIPLTQFEDEFVELFVATSPNDFYLLANGTDIYYSEDGGESFSLLQTLSNQPFKAGYWNNSWYLYGRGLWKLDESSSRVEPNPLLGQTRIFPNPVTNNLHIENQLITSYELFTASGAFVCSGLIKNAQIDMSQLSAGVFTIKLSDGKNHFVKKVVKL